MTVTVSEKVSGHVSSLEMTEIPVKLMQETISSKFVVLTSEAQMQRKSRSLYHLENQMRPNIAESTDYRAHFCVFFALYLNKIR